MEVLIKLNPAEAMAAIESGAFKFIIESAHAAQDKAENVIRAAQAAGELNQGAQPVTQIPNQSGYAREQQGQQPNQPVYTQPQGQQVQTSAVPVTQPGQVQTQGYDPNQAPAGAIPTVAQTYTMEQLAVAATQLVDAGRRLDLVNLLNSFGVQALTALSKEQYGAFATQLRAMGAKI